MHGVRHDSAQQGGHGEDGTSARLNQKKYQKSGLSYVRILIEPVGSDLSLV